MRSMRSRSVAALVSERLIERHRAQARARERSVDTQNHRTAHFQPASAALSSSFATGAVFGARLEAVLVFGSLVPLGFRFLAVPSWFVSSSAGGADDGRLRGVPGASGSSSVSASSPGAETNVGLKQPRQKPRSLLARKRTSSSDAAGGSTEIGQPPAAAVTF